MARKLPFRGFRFDEDLCRRLEMRKKSEFRRDSLTSYIAQLMERHAHFEDASMEEVRHLRKELEIVQTILEDERKKNIEITKEIPVIGTKVERIKHGSREQRPAKQARSA